MSPSRKHSDHSAAADDDNERESSVRVGASVLLVEDDGDTRASLRSLLEDDGYRVLEAENGQRALDVLFSAETQTPCLIVLEIGLPDVSGAEILSIVKSYHRFSTIPVLVISGTDPPRKVFDFGGVVACLRKPIDSGQFLGLVHASAATH